MSLLFGAAWTLAGVALTATAAHFIPTSTPALKMALRGITLLLWAWFVWSGLVLAFQRALLYPAPKLSTPRPQIPHALHLDVPHPEGQIEGWLLPGEGVTAAHPGPVVIYTHGNAELVEMQFDWLAPYRARGWSVAMLEYRGYGRAPGRPTQAGLVADARAFYDRLVTNPLVDPKRVVFHGRSLGGAVAVALHAERPATALILESTFTAIGAFAHGLLVPEFLVLDPWPSAEVLRKTKTPTLVFHGVDDTLIPIAHGRALAQAAQNSTLIERQCGHNDCVANEAFWRAIWVHLAQ